MIRIGEWRIEKYPAFLAQRTNPRTGDTETRGLIQPRDWNTLTRYRQRKCLETQVALLSSHGVYQHCGEKHLHRYLAEFEFRYNNRSAVGVEDQERAQNALRGVVGKRLTYGGSNTSEA